MPDDPYSIEGPPGPSKSVAKRLWVQVLAKFEDQLRHCRSKKRHVYNDREQLVVFMKDLVDSTRARLVERAPIELELVDDAEKEARASVEFEHVFAMRCTELVWKE